MGGRNGEGPKGNLFWWDTVSRLKKGPVMLFITPKTSTCDTGFTECLIFPLYFSLLATVLTAEKHLAARYMLGIKNTSIHSKCCKDPDCTVLNQR